MYRRNVGRLIVVAGLLPFMAGVLQWCRLARGEDVIAVFVTRPQRVAERLGCDSLGWHVIDARERQEFLTSAVSIDTVVPFPDWAAFSDGCRLPTSCASATRQSRALAQGIREAYLAPEPGGCRLEMSVVLAPSAATPPQ